MELRDFVRVLRAHWVGVLLIVAIAGIATVAYTEQQPEVYAADANGFVSAGTAADPALGSVNDQLAKSRAVSYVDIAKSRATAQEVVDALGLDAEPAALVGAISVEQPVDTVLIKITAEAPTPTEAQALADAWVSALATQVAKIEDPLGDAADGTPRVIPIESAELPTAPISPQPARNMMLGLALGVLMATGYAFARSTMDRRLRDPDAVERRFGVSVVGKLPTARALAYKHASPTFVALQSGQTSKADAIVAEAFRKLRTNLLFMDIDNPPRVIVVTSPRPGDGKSTVSANLAAAIAASGQPVALVDADMRRPSIASSLGLVEGVGLTDVLVGRVGLEDALQDVASVGGLRVLAAGSPPPNPSELLGSKTMRSVIERLAEDHFVVLDTPPLLPVTDAAVLTANADGALIVVTAGKTIDKELEVALQHLRAVNGKALGVILNKVPRRGVGSDSYATYYGDYPTAASQGEAPSRGDRRAGRAATEGDGGKRRA
jgi:capsular exopolysaccharide synthesis family protein